MLGRSAGCVPVQVPNGRYAKGLAIRPLAMPTQQVFFEWILSGRDRFHLFLINQGFQELWDCQFMCVVGSKPLCLIFTASCPLLFLARYIPTSRWVQEWDDRVIGQDIFLIKGRQENAEKYLHAFHVRLGFQCYLSLFGLTLLPLHFNAQLLNELLCFSFLNSSLPR